MNELTEQQISELQRFGFDLELQRRWQNDIAEGRLSKATNSVGGDLLVPALGTIHQLPSIDTKAHKEIEQLGRDAIKNGELGVVVLNGGMATRFGGVVKGIVPVLGKSRTFLGLAVQDVLMHRKAADCHVPFYCMNSFATDEATRAHFSDHAQFGLSKDCIHHLTQSVAVRMTKSGELFALENGEPSPYGPGHGDFASSFRKSGALKQFIDGGGRYLLVRNVDNLGARIDPLVLGHHINSGCDMTGELAPKWPDDVGGSPFQYLGRTQLIEQLRYPDGFDPNIVDVFNTNTFTFSANAIDREFELGWYYVEKKVEERDAVQVEHLLGEMTAHLSTNFLQVRRNGRRTRFLPVKTPDDLQSALEEIADIYDGSDEDDDI
ncbi:MAG: UTP--glucose-1-phosphate uridylyltransferase [Planctomycetota bacterium]